MTEAWDGAAWETLEAELTAWQEAGRVATLWWRDDDAGPGDPALARLLALAAREEVPLGLAVVPASLSPEAADLIHAAPSRVVVLQHGFAHANHETRPPAGAGKIRPAECGSARPAAAALDEIGRGYRQLQAVFAARYRPVFVPPWNRIAPAVVAGLTAVGHRGVSAFGPRPAPDARAGLAWLNCHVDPIVWREGRRFVGARATLDRLTAHLAARRAHRGDPREPTGFLTHHRDMDPVFWAFLERLLGRLGAHPGVRLCDLANPRPGGDSQACKA